MSLISSIKNFFTLSFGRAEKINISYPLDWEHMSHEDFRNVCTIMSSPHGRKETLFLCLCALAHMRPDNPIKYSPKVVKDNCVFLIGGKSYVISPKVISEACTQLEYILDSVGLPPSPFPKVDRRIYGLSFEQFFRVDANMMRYQAENNEAWLKEAVKVLTNGSVRKMLPWQKKGVVIWWNGVKNYLKEKYPYIFQDGEGGATFQDKSQADILQELLSVMNSGKPQDNDAILKSEVHSVLFILNKKYEENAHS